jgi:S1-C subfamily serine protease
MKKHFPFFILLLILVPCLSAASDEDAVKLKIQNCASELLRKSRIEEPTQSQTTRSPTGSKSYRAVSDGVVLVVTKDDKMGSGAVISGNGLLITNWHVVDNNAVVGVLFKQIIGKGKSSLKEEDVFFAKVLKIDTVRDLALLQLLSPFPNLTVLRLGLFSQVEIGQDVFAISHPEGLLWSYTEGVISQIHPDYSMKSESGKIHKATYLQTQTVISHGSSGGALFAYDGQMVGILVASLGPGLNFAIAVNEVKEFVISYIEKRQ